MTERVRVFICEECGEAFLGSVNAFDEGYHVRRYDGCDHDCGPITERILADPDVVRRETIEECANAVGAISHRIIISRACAMSTIRALADAPRETEPNGGG